jgi:ACR3 family arsenite efflux pump ArsB
MNNIQKRFILFLFLCIPSRFFLSYLIKKINTKYKSILATILLFIGIGFLIIYLGNFRKKGAETFGDNIWWNHLRPIHSFMYLYTSYLMFNNNNNSHIFIFYDTIIGVISFLLYHYYNDNFKKLF